jgi:hypothetical protein
MNIIAINATNRIAEIDKEIAILLKEREYNNQILCDHYKDTGDLKIETGTVKAVICPIIKSSLSREYYNLAVEYTKNIGIFDYFAKFTLSDTSIKNWLKENKEQVDSDKIANELKGFLEFKEEKPRITIKEVI